MSTIGKRIHDRRIQMGLSADDLAARLGKNRATIYRYEGDEIENLPISVIAPLAQVLQVSPAYLMGWSNTEDVYSARFRTRLGEKLSLIERPGTPEGDADYFRLRKMVDDTAPLSLADACDAADAIGCSMSYMLQEIAEDIDLSASARQETSDPAKPESEVKVEREIIGRVKKMDFAQQTLLLAILKTSAEQGRQTPLASLGTTDDKVKVSDR
ncbi:MAG: helix-turn-helix transcriptional regulator [Synergistaceae bacterium]|nr:helix-turn-helix transcriptional regulator [Synergistaceae bacterium]